MESMRQTEQDAYRDPTALGRGEALRRLMQELETGKASGEGIPEAEVYRMFGEDMP